MNLLAVDTAGRTCSTALVSNGRLRAELFVHFDQTHARHLMKLVDSLMQLVGLQIADMDAYGVTVGPGSFTGLRIGLATVKGFALACNKPVVGITSLSALAYPLRENQGLLCPTIDARKGEVYAQIYKAGQNALTPFCQAWVCAPEALAEYIRQFDAPCRFMGSGALLYRDLLESRLGEYALFAPDAANHIRAGVVGEMAWHRASRGQVQTGFELVPEYIRNSDAERKKAAPAGVKAAR
ncbi:MAG: tRNA (adenosine(37)-N6)-threonylcarbamoyltransferase complex dimerization subunit type 1 TsaB [Desulfobacterales bacterium]